MGNIFVRPFLERSTTPEEIGVDSTELIEFFNDCKKYDLRFKNIIITRHGKVAAECTKSPYDKCFAHSLFSCTKPIMATAIGFALSEGVLSLDCKMNDFFKGCYTEKQLENTKDITIYHLLTMTAGKGFSSIDRKEKPGWLDRYVLPKAKSKPGEKHLYISEAPYVLSRILCKVTGMSVVDYLMSRLFEPLGIERPFWETDSEGYEAGGWGLYLTIEDLTKIAECYLHGGVFDGKQVIPESYIKEATYPHRTDLVSQYAKDMGYGYNIWCNSPTGYYRFEGLYGENAFIYPEYEACIVMNGSEILLKKILLVVDKHFPKAFSDNLPAQTNQQKNSLENIVSSFSSDIIRPAPQNSKKEKEVSGRTIKTNEKYFSSMICVSSKFTLKTQTGKMTDIVFDFKEDFCAFSWRENEYKNTVKISLDGEQRISKIFLGEVDLNIAAFGAWQKDGTFIMQFFTMELPDEKTFIVKFGKRHVVAKERTTPKIGELAEFKMQFDGVPYAISKIIGKIATLIASPIVAPGFKGKY